MMHYSHSDHTISFMNVKNESGKEQEFVKYSGIKVKKTLEKAVGNLNYSHQFFSVRIWTEESKT